MDWPHDPDGEKGSEGRRKYGQAILAKKLDAEDFPVEAASFEDEYGDHPVRLDDETVISVADIFAHVEATTFETFPEFHTAVGDAMRGAGYWPLERESA
ncbi:hypothetical protein Hrd1104_03530 [Halorhabdus sp. CBA1104]|uniref:DUF5785 family protein n=1 Tax=unclassified Halorhabdus TaxID=2621901 RepID=UPI0012B2EA64|nr:MULTISPECIES: DUF5785 family protein [unclassified Halorhabdus]QGN06454.1 hypothetical protein Hrd1104_03530 [Halorhabdus sp. CBA1104]